MPTAGKILFDDFDATNTPVQDRQIGFVFQNYALFNHKTVAENIRFGLEVRKLKIDHNQRVNDLLELVQLEGLGDRFPKQLSGGQRQRVALARSLASNPKLLLLDEPFGALDAVVRKTLRAGLKEIVRSVGVTTIIVTHDQEEAFDLADKVVIFNRGRIEQQGSPEDIIKKPRTPFIMKFVGDTNIVPATSQLLRKANFTTHKPWAMFRPSNMQLSSTLCDASAPAQVSERHNLGWIIKYHLKFDDEVEIMYNVTRDQDEKQYNLHVGQRVYVRLPASALMGFELHEIESAPITS
ncbi:P-loop containing nucleoside triphosphate hydrolase protein [Dunaliella salina]|nr:P-loop containing nucleoside triphosphate hydrolase protein [Dunaliella salina]|eukprot:KAF5836512.1 P-loop containing nucleoside triphosphate hydrolase protein [Dunaliella salina]